MPDIATLGLAVDSRPVASANRELDRFVVAGGRTQQTADRTAQGFRNMAQHAAALPGPIGMIVSRLATMTGGVAAAIVAVTGLALVVGGKAVQAFGQLEEETARYNAVIRTTGFAAGKTGEDIEGLATSIRKSTAATEGDVRSAAAILLTFKSVSGEAFDETLKLAQDLSAVGFGSLTSSALQLGKALEDPVNGLQALRRVGVSFSESQRQVIKNFLESGQQAKAQEVILQGVRQQVGGAGSSVGGGLTGAYNQLGEATNNLLERWGEQIVKGTRLDAVIRGIAGAIDSVNQKAERQSTPQGRLDAVDAAISERQGRPSSFVPGIDAANQREIARLLAQRVKLLGEVKTAQQEVDAGADAAEFGRLTAEIERQQNAVGGLVIKLNEEKEALGKTALQREIDERIKRAGIDVTTEAGRAAKENIEQLAKENFYSREGSQLLQQRVAMLGQDASVTETVSAKRREINDAIKAGNSFTREEIALMLQRARIQAENSKLPNQLAFERAQIGRTDIEATVASRLRSEGLPIDFSSAAASAIRFNEQMRQARDLTTEFVTGFAGEFRNQLRQGATAFEAFGSSGLNALTRLSDKLMDMALSNLVAKAFGGAAGSGFNFLSLFGGGAGVSASAMGNAFDHGRIIHPFAMGGIVSDIVTKPTMFPMAKGAGLMGEAGPEAVMPLRRGADGRLGVSAGGNKGGDTYIHNDNRTFNDLTPALEARLDARFRAERPKIIQEAMSAMQKRRGRDPNTFSAG